MSDEKKDSDTTYYTLAITFGAIAVVFAITMDNPALALPFGVLALTFLVIGFQQKNGRGEAGEPGPDDEPTPDTDRP